MLVQQNRRIEVFPNGGLRNTFEARGYSAWDPSSPAFITRQDALHSQAYSSPIRAEALDFKTPLLKSLHGGLTRLPSRYASISTRTSTKVNVTLGWEQEYFLVDEALFPGTVPT
ncbi:MAG: glutamine synthetase III [Alistipes indistinctus]